MILSKDKFEHLDPNISNEAIQNIASIYNKDKLAVTNADITNEITTKRLNVNADDYAQLKTIHNGKNTWIGPSSGGTFDIWSEECGNGFKFGLEGREVMNLSKDGILFAPRLYTKGGDSSVNPEKWDTHFAWAGDNKNYIRGDTEIKGHTHNIGDMNIDGNLSHVVGSIPRVEKWHVDDQWKDLKGKIGKPIYDYFNTFLKSKPINTFHSARAYDEEYDNSDVILIFDGIKVSATDFIIKLNFGNGDFKRFKFS